MRKRPAPKTKSQLMAEKARQLTNNATDEERQRLLSLGMRMIYGDKGAIRARRR